MLIAIKHGINYRRVTINTPYECVCCYIELANFSCYVLSVYVPPNVGLNAANLRPIFTNVPSLILGDFNAHSYLWGPVNLPDRADVIEYLLEDYNMSVLNNGTPTRNPAPPTERRAPDLSICSASLRQNYTWAVF